MGYLYYVSFSKFSLVSLSFILYSWSWLCCFVLVPGTADFHSLNPCFGMFLFLVFLCLTVCGRRICVPLGYLLFAGERHFPVSYFVSGAWEPF